MSPSELTDHTDYLDAAFKRAIESGEAVSLPSGTFRVTRPLAYLEVQKPIAIHGTPATRIQWHEGGPLFGFKQHGLQQPCGLTVRDVIFEAGIAGGTALTVHYHKPNATNDHQRPAVQLTDLVVESGEHGAWDNGIDIADAWNASLQNVFVSGDSYGGDWSKLSGSGIRFRRSCVNAHLQNVKANFFEEGLTVDAEKDHNTEGIFCSNCSMVAVRRGVRIRGNPAYMIGTDLVPRISTFTWQGGLIEVRIADNGIRAAIQLENVWTALICGAQLLANELPPSAPNPSYGVLVQTSRGVVVSACDINSWNHGMHTAGECHGVNVNGCTFTNVPQQTTFAPGSQGGRSYGHTVVNGKPYEWAHDTTKNLIGFR